MSDAERIAKLQAYQMTDEEIERLNVLALPFIDTLRQEFGSRANVAVVNVMASQLAHALANPDEGFCVLSCVNDWLAGTALSHGGMEYRIVWRGPDGEWEAEAD
jgi:hypothetical protein